MKIIDQTSKTNWKFLAIVVIFTVLTGGGVIWYAQSFRPSPPQTQTVSIPKTPTPQQQLDTSTLPRDELLRGWQTYRNEEFGFEVKYPSGYQLIQGVQGGSDGFSLKIHQAREQENVFSLFINDNGRGLSPNLKQRDYLIGGVNANGYVFSYNEFGQVTKETLIVFFKDNDSYNILTSKYKNEDSEKLIIFDQILSTFRFVPTP